MAGLAKRFFEAVDNGFKRRKASKALLAAVIEGNYRDAKSALAAGADVGAFGGKLLVAATRLEHGSGAMVRMLLAAGADPNGKGAWRPLLSAIYSRQPYGTFSQNADAVEALLAAGAHVTSGDIRYAESVSKYNIPLLSWPGNTPEYQATNRISELVRAFGPGKARPANPQQAIDGVNAECAGYAKMSDELDRARRERYEENRRNAEEERKKLFRNSGGFGKG